MVEEDFGGLVVIRIILLEYRLEPARWYGTVEDCIDSVNEMKSALFSIPTPHASFRSTLLNISSILDGF
jgi:hypothetical protein